jgi:hypothetical protein
MAATQDHCAGQLSNLVVLFALSCLSILQPNQLGNRVARKRRYAEVFDDEDLNVLPLPKRPRRENQQAPAILDFDGRNN